MLHSFPKHCNTATTLFNSDYEKLVTSARLFDNEPRMLSNPDFSFPSKRNSTPTHESRRSSGITPSSPPAGAPSARHSGSHHRRQSSVSSRRESHEMMGINSLPFDQDDNPTTGDQRQRALWALEGRNPSLSSSPAQPPVNFSFGTVAIPNWKTPEVERDDHACEFLPPWRAYVDMCRVFHKG